jgi:hypothetical protein
VSNLYVISGDAYTGVRRLTVTATDPAGAALDLTGTTLVFMVKRRRSDEDADALISKQTPTDVEIASPQSGATKGKAYIALEEEDTEDLDGRYYWELEAGDAVGRLTLAAGVFRVTADLVEGS